MDNWQPLGSGANRGEAGYKEEGDFFMSYQPVGLCSLPEGDLFKWRVDHNLKTIAKGIADSAQEARINCQAIVNERKLTVEWRQYKNRRNLPKVADNG